MAFILFCFKNQGEFFLVLVYMHAIDNKVIHQVFIQILHLPFGSLKKELLSSLSYIILVENNVCASFYFILFF
jgi:hypothetical protein